MAANPEGVSALASSKEWDQYLRRTQSEHHTNNCTGKVLHLNRVVGQGAPYEAPKELLTPILVAEGQKLTVHLPDPTFGG